MASWFEDYTVLASLKALQNPLDQLSVVTSGLVPEDVLTEGEDVSWGEFAKARLEDLLPEFRR